MARGALLLVLALLASSSSAYPLFVDSTGSSTVCTSSASPCASISLAMNAALSQPDADEVRVRIGDYYDSFTMVDGVDIVGGYDVNWDLVPQVPSSTKVYGNADIDGEAQTAFATGVTARISNIELIGQDVSDTYPGSFTGRNTFVLTAHGDSDITLADVIITAGDAAHGITQNGAGGSTSGSPGSNSNGLAGECQDSNQCCYWWGKQCCDDIDQPGGNGGSGAENGGKGGVGGAMDKNCGTQSSCSDCNDDDDDQSGHSGKPSGRGGLYGRACRFNERVDGLDGSNGGDGSNGNDGSDAAVGGTFIGGYWRSNAGTDGSDGQDGVSGGGGGGGGACDSGVDSNGSGGGGGGGSGSGGDAGLGGGGGGWSVGIQATDNAIITVDEGCLFYAGNAGDGGDSGAGGAGRNGAGGGNGAGAIDNDFDDAGRGGDGGSGGDGGDGGDGGAGSAGISSLIVAGDLAWVRWINTTAFFEGTGSSGRSGCGPNGLGCPGPESYILDCYTVGLADCQSLASCGTACGPRQYCNFQNATCLCDDGWTGDSCETPVCDPPCANGGICSVDHTCACGSTGFSGPTCEFAPCLVNGEPGDCGEHGTCLSSAGNCTCEPGWESETTGCTTPVCAGLGCDEGQECVAPNTCSCPPGWAGPICSVPVCDAECNLENGFCNLDRVCECYAGWSGPECRTPCDECEGPEEEDNGPALFGLSQSTIVVVGGAAGAFMFTVSVWGVTRRTGHKKTIVPGSIKRERMKSTDLDDMMAGSAALPSTLTLPESSVPLYDATTRPMDSSTTPMGNQSAASWNNSQATADAYESTRTTETLGSYVSVDDSIYDTAQSMPEAPAAVTPAPATTVVQPQRSPSGRTLPAGLPPMPTRNPDMDEQSGGGRGGRGGRRGRGGRGGRGGSRRGSNSGRKKSGSRSPGGRRRSSQTRRKSNEGGLGAPPNRSPGKPRGNRSPRRDTDF